MKKLLLILIFSLFLAPFTAEAISPVFLHLIGSGTVCTETYAPSLTADAYTPISRYANIHFTGFLYTPTSNVEVCALDIYIESIGGNVTSKGYYAQIWTIDGSNQLNTLLGTSNRVLGTSIVATTWISANAGLFQFSSAISLTGSTTYGVVVFVDTDSDPNDVPEIDGTNYINWGRDTGNDGDSIQNGECRWTHTDPTPHVVYGLTVGDDILVKIHTME